MSESETIIYIDPFSGVSGDMMLAALISLGVPLEVITEAVEKVIPGEVRIAPEQVTRSGLAGTRCDVQVVGGPEKRTLDEMIQAVENAGLDEQVASGSLDVLDSLGEAESRAHGMDRSSGHGDVHLHELGGQDTLADIVGVQAALHWLAPARICCGSVNLGWGYVETSHGRMPVPAPATAFLVEGVPVHAEGPQMELTTPTGAALIRGIVSRFGPMPSMTVDAVGVGAGTAEPDGFPNLLRIFRGTSRDGTETGTGNGEGAVIIECGVDDLSPEYMAPSLVTIQDAGAKEVHLIPVLAKKGRPGILVRALSSVDDKDNVARAMLEATGSSGLRFWEVGRQVLDREMLTVSTPHGPVVFKMWKLPSGNLRYKPEYEDIRQRAQEAGIPILKMKELAVKAYLASLPDELADDPDGENQ